MSLLNSAIAAAVGTTPVAVLTVPAGNAAVLIGGNLANILTSAMPSVTVTVVRGGVTINVIKAVPIPVNSGFTFSGTEQKLILMAGDVLNVVSDTADSIDVLISYSLLAN